MEAQSELVSQWIKAPNGDAAADIVVNLAQVMREGAMPVKVASAELFAGIDMPFGLVIPAAYQDEDEYNAVVAAEIAALTGGEERDGDSDTDA